MTDRAHAWRHHLPWALLSLLALAQLFAVHSHGLSRWRGGGFGMYSEPHPNETEVWFVSQKSARRLDHRADPRPHTHLLCARAEARLQALRALPTKARLDTFFIECIPDTALPQSGEEAHLELWSRRFDPDEMAYKRRLTLTSTPRQLEVSR